MGAVIEVVNGMHVAQSQDRLVTCREMPEHLSSAR